MTAMAGTSLARMTSPLEIATQNLVFLGGWLFATTACHGSCFETENGVDGARLSVRHGGRCCLGTLACPGFCAETESVAAHDDRAIPLGCWGYNSDRGTGTWNGTVISGDHLLLQIPACVVGVGYTRDHGSGCGTVVDSPPQAYGAHRRRHGVEQQHDGCCCWW